MEKKQNFEAIFDREHDLLNELFSRSVNLHSIMLECQTKNLVKCDICDNLFPLPDQIECNECKLKVCSKCFYVPYGRCSRCLRDIEFVYDICEGLGRKMGINGRNKTRGKIYSIISNALKYCGDASFLKNGRVFDGCDRSDIIYHRVELFNQYNEILEEIKSITGIPFEHFDNVIRKVVVNGVEFK